MSLMMDLFSSVHVVHVRDDSGPSSLLRCFKRTQQRLTLKLSSCDLLESKVFWAIIVVVGGANFRFTLR